MTSLRGMLLLVLAATSFGFMAFFVKLATDRVGAPQVAALRFLLALVPFLVFPSVRRASLKIHRVRPLFYRGVFGGLAVLLYFSAIQHIPIGVAALLNTTAPIFSGVFAAIFLGERLHIRVLAPLALTIGGIVIVVHSHATEREWFGFGAWETAALASAVCAGAAVTAIRGARRTESTWATVSSFSVFGLVATVPVAVWNWRPLTRSEWLIVVLVAAFALAGQLLMTFAYRWVETLTAGVITQFTVIVAMGLGVVYLGDQLDGSILIGTGLTIAGVAAVITLTSRRDQKTG